jgi:hypothetical protein
MSRTVTSLLGPSRRPASHQELALAVIIRAIRDLDLPDGKSRNEARMFLRRHAALGQWCGVAGIDRDFVQDVVRKRLARRADSSRPR